MLKVTYQTELVCKTSEGAGHAQERALDGVGDQLLAGGWGRHCGCRSGWLIFHSRPKRRIRLGAELEDQVAALDEVGVADPHL
jgi:hypothetical protein